MTISTNRKNTLPVGKAAFPEMVERKGKGHPDSVADEVAEACSRALSRYYQDKRIFYIKTFSTPLLILFCLISCWIGMGHYGLMTILGNPVIAPFVNELEPLFVVIKKMAGVPLYQ